MLTGTSTITRDINTIRQPHTQTLIALCCHKHQLSIYHPYNQPDVKCDICCNYATARYDHDDDVFTLLCSDCVLMRAGCGTWVMCRHDTLRKMEMLRTALPALRNTAKITFERLLYREQIREFDRHDFAQHCVLCHRATVYVYECDRSTIVICNDCGVLARNNIAIRVHKMYLGSQVIASMRQHDIYTSVVRLYLALLWDIMPT